MNKWLDTTVRAYQTYIQKQTPKPVVYDVGSRDGQDGAELAARIYGGQDLWADADIVLFEPNPDQIKVIQHDYPKATLIPYAIDITEGTHDFVKITGTEGEVGSSSLDTGRLHTKTGGKEIIQVQTKRLDGIIADLGHEYIDIMKIDTEGYSWPVLHSMGDLLHNVYVLHVETETANICLDKTNLEIFDFMRDQGFLCFAREHEWGADIEDQVWVNSRYLHA